LLNNGGFKESNISIPDFNNSNLDDYRKKLQAVDCSSLEAGSFEKA
jgi:hypothetical protein